MPAIIKDGTPVELFPGLAFTDAGEIQRPSNWLEFATDNEKAEAGVVDIVEPPPAPEGKVIRVTGLAVIDGLPTRTFVVEDAPAPPVPVAPDNPTLGDWRVGLALWVRTDASGATVTRLTDVTNAVAAVMASDKPQLAIMGQVAHQRLEYSNNVLKAEVTQLAPAFQFSAADVDESFWRADRVRQGDLSGVWPLPAEQGASA